MKIPLQRLLVIIGLIAIPFYELIFKVFPYVKVMAPDTREPKQLIAVGFALAIGLLAVFQGKIKPFNNKFLLVIPLYLLLNLWMAPTVELFINNVNCGDLYFWKPFSQVLCFSLMIIAIASSEDDNVQLLNIIVWCGTIMAGYVILQRFGFDQFWVQKEPEKWVAVMKNAEIGGNLGQSTVVASFIAMIVPLAIYLKKYWMIGIMALAVVLTESDMSIIALLLIGLVCGIRYFGWNYRREICLVLLVILIGFSFMYFKNDKVKSFINERASGRTGTWGFVIDDIKDGAIEGVKQDYSFTGVGFGRFPFIFPDRHKTNFAQAHNDPLEFIYNCGVIGIILLIIGLVFMFRHTECNFLIMLSFATILFISLGSFPFQLGAHQFYSALLVGLLHKSGGVKCS